MTSSSELGRTSTWAAAAVVSVVLATFAAAPIASAQTKPTAAPGDPKEMARRLGEEALSLHQEGRFEEAYAKLETAERIAHSPVFLVWMARAKRATGRLLAARALYEKVVAEALPAGASPNWVKARADAVAEGDALTARIPRVEVRLTAGAPADARIEVDGRPVRSGERIEIDPGEHIVRAVATGVAPVERRVLVEEGVDPPPVQLELTAARPGTSAEPRRGSIVPGAVALGVGGLALVGGAIGGAYALVLAGEVHDGCQGDLCRHSDAGKADDADTLARVATGFLVGGAVVSAAGIVLLVTRPFGASESVTVALGPTSARLRARF